MWPLVLLPAAALAAGAGLFRSRAARAAEGAYVRRFPAGPDGIAQGAEPFMLRAPGTRAVLMLHGSGDTPQTLRYLGERLQAAGYSVYAPLLPGHGRSPAAFAHVTAGDYLRAAREALDVVRRDSSWIAVLGLSMGGALASQLAAEASDVKALVLLAPYMEPPAIVRWVSRLSWVWGAVVPFLEGRGEQSVQDVRARAESRAYGIFSPRAVRALVATARAGQRSLPAVVAPTLVVHSREDIRIPTVIAERATAALRAPTERRWVAGGGHVITVDSCRDEVVTMVLSFLDRVYLR